MKQVLLFGHSFNLGQVDSTLCFGTIWVWWSQYSLLSLYHIYHTTSVNCASLTIFCRSCMSIKIKLLWPIICAILWLFAEIMLKQILILPFKRVFLSWYICIDRLLLPWLSYTSVVQPTNGRISISKWEPKWQKVRNDKVFKSIILNFK